MDRPTFSALLAERLRMAAGQPLVTFYDDLTGERVELSATTYANWVAKTGSLVQDELGLGRGDTLLVDLPTHWLTPVWLGAAWSLGLAVTPSRERRPVDLVVCGPESLPAHDAALGPVVALSLKPMGARFDHELPRGVIDYGAVVWGQPDVLVPIEDPEPDDVAWWGAEGSRNQRDLLEAARRSPLAQTPTRLLTDLSPLSVNGLDGWLGPMVGGGSTVWVRHPGPSQWAGRGATEQATHVLRDGGSLQPIRS